MAKKYKIASVDYEFCFSDTLQDEYSDSTWVDILFFWSDWADYPLGYDDKHQTKGFSLNDGYDYVDSIEELIPPQLTSADKDRLRAEIKKHLIEIK